MARPSPALRSIRTARGARRVFVAQASPRLLGGAFAAAVARRALGRRPDMRDVAAVALVALARGPHEYAIHRWLLHAPRRTVRGVVVDPGIGHRAHHVDPDVLDDALLRPERAAVFLGLLALHVGAICRVLRLPASTRHTATAATWAALLAYEWRHFLDHTSVPLRTRREQQLRTHHRAHHHVDERFDLGITSRTIDRALARLASAPVQRGSQTTTGIRRSVRV